MEPSKFESILNTIQTILISIIPLGITIYYTVKDKIKESKRNAEKQNTARNIEKFNQWAHEESSNVITKIKNFCNYYKDKGHMDLVEYVQLENGTVASSRICNMFISCLAEDDRFGPVPKLINYIRRMPYSQVAEFVGNLKLCKSNGVEVLKFDDIEELHKSINLIKENSNIHSILSAPVYDSESYLIGFTLFYYSKPLYNGLDLREQEEELKLFTTAVETAFIDFHISRKHKMEELNLDATNVN